MLFRYVQTSTDVALSWANPTLICPGYLINLGAPAVPLDKTTNIEEFRRQQERIEETIAMDEDSKSAAEIVGTVHEKTVLTLERGAAHGTARRHAVQCGTVRCLACCKHMFIYAE